MGNSKLDFTFTRTLGTYIRYLSNFFVVSLPVPTYASRKVSNLKPKIIMRSPVLVLLDLGKDTSRYVAVTHQSVEIAEL